MKKKFKAAAVGLALAAGLMAAAPAHASAGGNELVLGERLWKGQSIGATSPGEYATYLEMQGDGNLVLYHWTWTGSGWSGAEVEWASNTVGCGDHLIVQDDGNLVLYAADNGVCWASNTRTGWTARETDVDVRLSLNPSGVLQMWTYGEHFEDHIMDPHWVWDSRNIASWGYKHTLPFPNNPNCGTNPRMCQ